MALHELALLSLVSLAFGVGDPTDRVKPPKRPDIRRPAVIPLFGDVDETMLKSVKRRIDQARRDGADTLVFDLDSYGGEVISAMEIGDAIFHIDEPYTIAYVSEKAISAGALIAMSAREIVMREGTDLGDCEPIYLSPTSGGIETAPEKIQSPLRAKFRKYAERSGVPVALAEAMVTKDLGAVRVRLEGEETARYLSAIEVEKWPEELRKRIAEKETVVERGYLLTVHAAQALKLGIATELVKDRADLLEKLGASSAASVPIYEELGLEKVARVLQSYKFLLFIIGVIGLYLEFKTPGFGVAGIVGLVALALFFVSSYLVDLAEIWEILLFVIGLALFALEIFVLPGFGLTGIAGIICILVAFYGAGTQHFLPDPSRETYAFELVSLRDWILQFSLSLIAIFVLAATLSRFLPHVPVFHRLILRPETAEGVPLHGTAAAFGGASAGVPSPGDTGIAITKLRPVGKARFGDRRIEVPAEGDFVELGERVRVLEVKGNRILVKREAGLA